MSSNPANRMDNVMNAQSLALEVILPDIRRAAYQIALEWPYVVERDDVEQEIAFRLLVKKWATKVAAMEPPARRKTLFMIAQQIASDERVDYEHFSGNFRYSTDEVRERLELGALMSVGSAGSGVYEQVGLGFDENGDIVPVRVEAEEFIIEDIDIRAAFARLPSNHRNALGARFGQGHYEGYRKDITRAVDALTAELNRAHRRAPKEHDGPGSRKAISNAQAAYITKMQLEK